MAISKMRIRAQVFALEGGVVAEITHRLIEYDDLPHRAALLNGVSPAQFLNWSSSMSSREEAPGAAIRIRRGYG